MWTVCVHRACLKGSRRMNLVNKAAAGIVQLNFDEVLYEKLAVISQYFSILNKVYGFYHIDTLYLRKTG